MYINTHFVWLGYADAKNHIKYKVINYNLLSSKSCLSIFQILGIQFII